MARVTVEDCLEEVKNRFGLVHITALRAKELMKGARPVYTCKNREIVTALREVAAHRVKPKYPEEESAE